jgi:serine/threonine-protein kinase
MCRASSIGACAPAQAGARNTRGKLRSVQAGDGIPFGAYRLVKRLARGGMAEVFLARQVGPEGFERPVAIKRILPHLVDSGDFVRMFLDEARVAARLQHPNIVHIYELGKVGEHYFIAMEYVPGIHAGTLIKAAATDPLPCALVARIGADACAALHHAHTLSDDRGAPLQLVHRDVSPPNLLLSRSGILKLVDFGIAKAANLADRTRPGVVKGKFAYMSPEQTVGRRLDGRSDVFSLAVVLWELLAGQVIVSRKDPVEAMRTIRDGNLLDIQEIRRDVPDSLADALRAALAANREMRSTAAELGRALEAFIKSCPDLGTSMQLAEWIGTRFPDPRTTGDHRALDGDRPLAGGTAIERTLTTRQSARAEGQVDPDGRETSRRTALHRRSAPPAMAGEILVPAAQRKGTQRTARLGVIASAALFTGVALFTVPDLLDRAEPAEVPLPGRVAASPRVTALAAPAPAEAILEVITTPAGAEVSVVGHGSATSPAHFPGLRPGAHLLVVGKPGYQPVERDVRLEHGQHLVIEMTLPRRQRSAAPAPLDRPAPPSFAAMHRRGQLSVSTAPETEAFLGDRRLGLTPLAGIELEPGTHELTFVHPDRAPHRRPVEIRPGRLTRLDFALP